MFEGSAVASLEPVEVVNGAVAAPNWPGSAYCAGDVILGGGYRIAYRLPARDAGGSGPTQTCSLFRACWRSESAEW